MDIIWAIRELCRGEHGFEDMFDKAKSKCFSGEDEYYDDGLKFNVK